MSQGNAGRRPGAAPNVAGPVVGVIFVILIIVGLGAATMRYAQVDEGERGLIITQGAVEGVQDPGIFFRPFAPFTRIEIVNVRRKTIEVTQNVASSDKQLYDIKVQVDYSRNPAPEALRQSYGLLGVSDDNLTRFLDGFVNDALKSASTQFTLDEVLADRGALSNRMVQLLTTAPEGRQSVVNQLYIQLEAVKVLDISVSEEYARLLSEKANLDVQIETEERRRQQIQAEQDNNLFRAQREADVALTTEKGRTAAQLEAVNRESQVRAIQGRYWRENPELLDLRKRELMVEMMKSGNIWFLDPATNLTLLLNNMSEGSIIPVPPSSSQAPTQPAPIDPESAPVDPLAQPTPVPANP